MARLPRELTPKSTTHWHETMRRPLRMRAITTNFNEGMTEAKTLVLHDSLPARPARAF